MNSYSWQATLGAVVISRNDGYGGDQPDKFIYCLRGLLRACDEVIYVDWNSPGGVSLFDQVRDSIPERGRLRHIRIPPELHRELVGEVLARPAVRELIPNIVVEDAQFCVEVLARNIGLARLGSDWSFTCNADVLCGTREEILRGIVDVNTFHCIARRETSFPVLRNAALPGTELLDRFLSRYGHQFQQHGPGSPLGERDIWSLITCPGDFQLAHRSVWERIRGFEESLLLRGYADSNVQKKAALAGYNLQLIRTIPAFHLAHYPDTGASGGTTNAGWNDADRALWNFTETTNPADWGFSSRQFQEEIH